MELSKELLEKAKAAKTAEELLEMAKAENIEMTAEEAEKAFENLHQSGELADEELDNVAAGCLGVVRHSSDGIVASKKDVVHLYSVGQTIEYINSWCTTIRSVITALTIQERGDIGHTYCPTYTIRMKDSGTILTDVLQSEIQIP